MMIVSRCCVAVLGELPPSSGSACARPVAGAVVASCASCSPSSRGAGAVRRPAAGEGAAPRFSGDVGRVHVARCPLPLVRGALLAEPPRRGPAARARTDGAARFSSRAFAAAVGVSGMGTSAVWRRRAGGSRWRGSTWRSQVPARLSGYTIVQLTDVHIGPTLDGAFIDAIIAMTARSARSRRHHGRSCGRVGGGAGQVRGGAPGLRAKDGVYCDRQPRFLLADAWVGFLGRSASSSSQRARGDRGASPTTASIWPAWRTPKPPLRSVPAHGRRRRAGRARSRARSSSWRTSRAIFAARERSISALGAHARGPDLPVSLLRSARSTVRVGAPPARGDGHLREPGDGLLGAADAPGRPRRDHPDRAPACLTVEAVSGRLPGVEPARRASCRRRFEAQDPRSRL